MAKRFVASKYQVPKAALLSDLENTFSSLAEAIECLGSGENQDLALAKLREAHQLVEKAVEEKERDGFVEFEEQQSKH
jgi:hypothetical protein